MTATFEKRVVEIAINRGLSRASVFCAMLIASGTANVKKIAPSKEDKCLSELQSVPPDVALSAGFNNLCKCGVEYYDDFAERHKRKCLYVKWRKLIDDPLESVLNRGK